MKSGDFTRLLETESLVLDVDVNYTRHLRVGSSPRPVLSRLIATRCGTDLLSEKANKALENWRLRPYSVLSGGANSSSVVSES